MIWESGPWKEELLRLARTLERRRFQKRWSPASQACLEREVFIGFFTVRKLMEAHKLTDAVAEQQVPLTKYRFVPDARVTLRNWHKVDELVLQESATPSRLPLRELCNQLIHSYVFVEVVAESNGLDGFFFCSDWSRGKCLYYASVRDVIQVFTSVGLDDPSEDVATWDPEKGDYRTHLR